MPKSNPSGDAAMTFEEIGRELGITDAGAWMAYNSGMKKLKHPANRPKMKRLLQLLKFRNAQRDRPTGKTIGGTRLGFE